MLERRSFLISCGALVTGLAPAKSIRAGTSLAVSPPQGLETRETPAVDLRIAGWDTSSAFEPDTGNRLWIGINRSWRAAWR